ncbi:hypothetical protein KKC32_04405 [Patescibacteria group bacterium]|nr:hypothetical protein [Patescibacteria group bacterium]
MKYKTPMQKYLQRKQDKLRPRGSSSKVSGSETSRFAAARTSGKGKK